MCICDMCVCMRVCVCACACVCEIVNAFATMCSYKSVFHHAGFVPGNVLR